MDPNRIAVLGLVGAIILGLNRALDKKVPAFANWSAALRLLLVSGLSIASGVVDAMGKGTTFLMAFVTVFAVGGPSFIDLFVTWIAHLISGSSDQVPPAAGGTVSGATPTSMRPQPSSYSARLMGLALAFGLLLPGCASIPKILTVISDVTSIVQEAESLAASARDEESQYFLRHPNAEAQAKVEGALSDVEQSLAAFSRASKGVTEASLGQLDAAQADFVLAWKKLEGVLRDLGVMHGNKIAASPGAAPTEIREPLLLTAKLHS